MNLMIDMTGCEPGCPLISLDGDQMYMCTAHGSMHMCGSGCTLRESYNELLDICTLTRNEFPRSVVDALRTTAQNKRDRMENGKEIRKFSTKTLRGALQMDKKQLHTPNSDDTRVIVEQTLLKIFNTGGQQTCDTLFDDLVPLILSLWVLLRKYSTAKSKLDIFVIGFCFLLQKDITITDGITINKMDITKHLISVRELRGVQYAPKHVTEGGKIIRIPMLKMVKENPTELQAWCQKFNTKTHDLVIPES